jgi:hypothetical protein
MDTVGIHMVEMEGKDMTEGRPSKRRPEVEGKYMAEEHPSKRRPEVVGMDMMGIHIVTPRVPNHVICTLRINVIQSLDQIF